MEFHINLRVEDIDYLILLSSKDSILSNLRKIQTIAAYEKGFDLICRVVERNKTNTQFLESSIYLACKLFDHSLILATFDRSFLRAVAPKSEGRLDGYVARSTMLTRSPLNMIKTLRDTSTKESKLCNLREYIFAPLYQLALQSRAPTVDLVVKYFESSCHLSSIKSEYLNGFRNLCEINFNLRLASSSRSDRYRQIINETRSASGFASILATMMFCGDDDYNPSNFGVIPNPYGGLSWAKVDHGWASTVSDAIPDYPYLRIRKHLSKAYLFSNLCTVDFPEFIKTAKNLVKIPDETLSAIINLRARHLLHFGSSILIPHDGQEVGFNRHGSATVIIHRRHEEKQIVDYYTQGQLRRKAALKEMLDRFDKLSNSKMLRKGKWVSLRNKNWLKIDPYAFVLGRHQILRCEEDPTLFFDIVLNRIASTNWQQVPKKLKQIARKHPDFAISFFQRGRLLTHILNRFSILFFNKSKLDETPYNSEQTLFDSLEIVLKGVAIDNHFARIFEILKHYIHLHEMFAHSARPWLDVVYRATKENESKRLQKLIRDLVLIASLTVSHKLSILNQCLLSCELIRMKLKPETLVAHLHFAISKSVEDICIKSVIHLSKTTSIDLLISIFTQYEQLSTLLLNSDQFCGHLKITLTSRSDFPAIIDNAIRQSSTRSEEDKMEMLGLFRDTLKRVSLHSLRPLTTSASSSPSTTPRNLLPPSITTTVHSEAIDRELSRPTFASRINAIAYNDTLSHEEKIKRLETLAQRLYNLGEAGRMKLATLTPLLSRLKGAGSSSHSTAAENHEIPSFSSSQCSVVLPPITKKTLKPTSSAHSIYEPGAAGGGGRQH